MEVIINDFSLDAQFSDTEEFLESLSNITVPLLERLEDLQIKVLSSHNSYQLLITDKKTLYDMMKVRGSEEIRKFKRQLQELLFDDPYWNNDIKSIEEIYYCEYTLLKSEYCLAEALERNVPVISFEHEKFKESSIEIKKNDIVEKVKNIFNNEILLDILRENKTISHFDYIIFKHSLHESFGLKKRKNYFNELVETASLNELDQEIIINDMSRLIDFLKEGKDPGRLSDGIEGKLKEFRTSLTDNRQIRFFYFELSNKIIFLNGFLKKTQKAPQSEINKAKSLMTEYMKI